MYFQGHCKGLVLVKNLYQKPANCAWAKPDILWWWLDILTFILLAQGVTKNKTSIVMWIALDEARCWLCVFQDTHCICLVTSYITQIQIDKLYNRIREWLACVLASLLRYNNNALNVTKSWIFEDTSHILKLHPEMPSRILHSPFFLSMGIIPWGSCICLHSLFPRDSPSMLEDAQKMRFCYPPMLPLLPNAPLLAVLPLIPLHPLFLGGFLSRSWR